MNTEKKLVINIDSNMSVDEASAVLIGAVRFAIENGKVFNTDQITQLLAAMAKVTVPTEQNELQPELFTKELDTVVN